MGGPTDQETTTTVHGTERFREGSGTHAYSGHAGVMAAFTRESVMSREGA
jgi:hypothetical protein